MSRDCGVFRHLEFLVLVEMRGSCAKKGITKEELSELMLKFTKENKRKEDVQKCLYMHVHVHKHSRTHALTRTASDSTTDGPGPEGLDKAV